MIAARKDITIDRGGRKSFKVRFSNDISSALLKVVVYKNQKASEPIIAVIPEAIASEANTYLVTFTTADTSRLIDDKYIWGVKLEYPDGNYDLIIKGEVVVSWGLP